MTRLDGEREQTVMRLKKTVTIGQIKQRVETELGIHPDEQLLLFRGRRGVEAKDTVQPLSVPDLNDIIQEAGEKGLQMSVVARPKELPDFLRKEGLEEVNARRKSGATVLHRAVRKCKTYVMQELLEECEDFTGTDARDRAGQTALHGACAARLREPLERLLKSEKFTAVGARDVEGRTALHLAAMWGDAVACKLIMEHPNWQVEHAGLRDKTCGMNALQMATEWGNTDCVAVILQKCPGLESLAPPPDSPP
eukprot:CAMPEP_0195127568 /NCGR_PEP_ID=MMETSP0448-20130528/137292_1 /TAXON_ID=66468 /ORGANISM="Heterocapsa triquestra, Strain CCMP 448" /LENGTH=251 /DNA_ID=CAMNT_0040165323 /DNA_START=20 /DNA_END=771 /DNA_ORIENTATION=+